MNFQSMAGALLALVSIASAQTHTVCDPIKEDCPPNPALGGEVDIDYTKGKSDFFEESSGTNLDYDKQKGAAFTIENEKDAPTIESPEFIFFGKLEVELAVAPGVGIVTSIVLQSLTLDEIDWEWLGGNPDSVQTNYFSKGDTSTYDRGGTHPVSNAFDFHTYTIDWTQESITWSIDDVEVRVLTYADAKGGAEYPQTPMQVKLGSWVGGRSDAPQGTIDWAGGLANFDNGPSHAYYRRVSVTDYAGGVEGAKQYIYSDKSGTWESIFVDTQGGGGGLKNKGNEEEEEKDKDKDKNGENSSSAAVTPISPSDPTAIAQPTVSSTSDAEDDAGDDGKDNTEEDNADDKTEGDDATDSPAQEEDGGEDARGAASLSAQVFTCAGAVLSGAAVLANLL